MLQAVMTTTMPTSAPASSGADDRRLASGCAAGDAKVFEEIYRRFAEPMKSVYWSHHGNISDAEDAVQ